MGYYMTMGESSFFVLKKNADSVSTLLREEFFEPEFDEDGNITDLEFVGEKLRDQFDAFCKIAPLVAAGSYLKMSGEDGALWCWYFTGQTCEEHDGVYAWPTMDGYVLGAQIPEKDNHEQALSETED